MVWFGFSLWREVEEDFPKGGGRMAGGWDRHNVIYIPLWSFGMVGNYGGWKWRGKEEDCT